ncbi:hypothetical protein GGR04_001512 [Aureimonas pseudogalii]|uniref:DUF2171 domain-containing protein n=2 Tax=Aureimonas pseudogalii TaxID=1744844 RepID=A0A7W6ECU7_9HYPH|nr:hypothetical protein [Aureimonas pseudogalii]
MPRIDPGRGVQASSCVFMRMGRNQRAELQIVGVRRIDRRAAAFHRRSRTTPIAPPARRPHRGVAQARDTSIMATTDSIREHMDIIGADGVHVGTVDRVEGHRIKLTKKDSGEGSHEGHHHYISIGLVAEVEGDKVRLSANGDVAVTFEEEGDGSIA